jgi:para-nitrobenzyl esterase
MIVGTTLNEFAHGINHPDALLLSEAELQRRVAGAHSDRAETVIAAFRARTPDAKPFDLWSRIASASVRSAAIDQAAAKARQGGAPAWLYWFTWQTAVLDARPAAFHCAEIPFVFNNTDRCANMTGGGARARALAARIADAWIAFARTGDPNHPGLSRWPAYTAATPATMLLDDASRVEIAIDRGEQASIAA